MTYPEFPSWAVDYPLDSVFHKVFLYRNERVATPYCTFYVVDHESFEDLKPSATIPIGLPQAEDLHGYPGLDDRFQPHPSHYPLTRSNCNYYHPFRFATPREA